MASGDQYQLVLHILHVLFYSLLLHILFILFTTSIFASKVHKVLIIRPAKNKT